jgi:hypothetical protein
VAGDGGVSLIDTEWGGSYAPRQYAGKYWMSYIGGRQHGYEPDPLSIGIAWTTAPDKPQPWERQSGEPDHAAVRPEARPFEKKTLYKSTIIRDDAETLQHPFVMFYNAKQEGKQAIERIGCAVSADMLHWSRYGRRPGRRSRRQRHLRRSADRPHDPRRQARSGSCTTFGHRWRPKAFDTFACSRTSCTGRSGTGRA